MIFTLLTICFSAAVAAPSSAVNEFPIIGIVAQELDTQLAALYPAYSSFIAASYVKAAESSATRVVPIVPGRNESYYRDTLKSVNGVILPGGSSFNGPGFPYYDVVSHIYKISKEMNDQGTLFPVLGVCLGYEFLITIANKDTNILNRCKVNFENLPLKFSMPYEQTIFFSRLSEKQYDILSSSNVTVNHHKWCVLEKDFLNSSLENEWTVTSTSTSSSGLEFIATVEHKRYPFFGIQFHPEKIAFEWNPANHYPHSVDGLVANRYFYDTLAYFSRQNSNKFESARAENKSLIYNYPAQVLDNGRYQQLYLF